MLTLIAFAIAVFAISAALGLDRRRRQAEDEIKREQTKVRVLLDSHQNRYEIKVADWGPDFTGKGDILPRWRWSVVDADYALRVAFDPGGGPYEGPRVHMIGNAPSKPEAYLAAMAWIEKQVHPLVVVDSRSL